MNTDDVLNQLHERFTNVNLSGANGWLLEGFQIPHPDDIGPDEDDEQNYTVVGTGFTLEEAIANAARWLQEHPLESR